MVPPSGFAFDPFTELIEAIPSEDIRRFSDLQDRFIEAMSAFDKEQAAGHLTSGQNQAKGLFFNEVIALLIERCVGQGLGVARRGKRPGILLENVDVDICYPPDPGTRPEVIAETKMLGTPKHPGSPRQGRLGRPGSSDLDKRTREIALSVIDLKLADAQGGTTAIGDITTWIQQTRPPFFAFFGHRVVSEGDLKKIIDRADLLDGSYANGVGLVLYEPVDSSTDEGLVTYRSIPVPRSKSIDHAIERICRLIRGVAGSAPIPAEPAPLGAVPEELPEDDPAGGATDPSLFD